MSHHTLDDLEGETFTLDVTVVVRAKDRNAAMRRTEAVLKGAGALVARSHADWISHEGRRSRLEIVAKSIQLRNEWSMA